ncbi:hypothetical protein [Demequina activiva]|uniref:Uncharacterized protein n=1 Tax=Demequina activiva TaxID=1582364 RepID=A0A919UIG4_9MICO|nr:hypothetical protein [Demequina activiva]GIG53366.1 hypothetical protein Dac01nite_01180 [Demequina activiva]
MTIEETPPPSVSAERSSRRRHLAVGLGVSLAVLIAVGVLVAAAATHRPFMEWYTTDGAELEVTYSVGAGERLLWARADEDGERVLVDVMVVSTLPPGAPRNAAAEEKVASFELDAPVGDREVITSDGAVLREVGVG